MNTAGPSPSAATSALRRHGGCLFVLGTCVVSLLLFGVNNTVVEMLYTSLSPKGPDWLKHRNTAQFILFAGPVLLLFVEWWLMELGLQALRTRRTGR